MPWQMQENVATPTSQQTLSVSDNLANWWFALDVIGRAECVPSILFGTARGRDMKTRPSQQDINHHVWTSSQFCVCTPHRIVECNCTIAGIGCPILKFSLTNKFWSWSWHDFLIIFGHRNSFDSFDVIAVEEFWTFVWAQKMPGCGCLNNSVCPKCGRLKTYHSCLDTSKWRCIAEWQVPLNLRWIEDSCRRFLFGYWGWWQNHHGKADPWQTDQRHSKHFTAITNPKECWKNSATVVLYVDMLQVGKLWLRKCAMRKAYNSERRRPKRRGRGRTLDWKSVGRVRAVVFCSTFILIVSTLGQWRLKTTFSDFVWQCFQKSLFRCLFPKAQPRGSSKECGPYTAIF